MIIKIKRMRRDFELTLYSQMYSAIPENKFMQTILSPSHSLNTMVKIMFNFNSYEQAFICIYQVIIELFLHRINGSKSTSTFHYCDAKLQSYLDY